MGFRRRLGACIETGVLQIVLLLVVLLPVIPNVFICATDNFAQLENLLENSWYWGEMRMFGLTYSVNLGTLDRRHD